MAVTQVGTPNTAARVTATGTLSPTWAASQPRTAGDALLAAVGIGAVTSSSALPAGTGGWTKLTEVVSGNERVAWYWAVAAGGDAAPTFAVTFSGTGAAVGGLIELTGNDSTTPLVAACTGTGSGTTSALSLTTAANVPAAGCFSLTAFASLKSSAATVTWTPGTGWTTNAVNDDATSSRVHLHADTHAPSSGSADSEAVTLGFTPTAWVGQIIVVQPPAAVVAAPELVMAPMTGA